MQTYLKRLGILLLVVALLSAVGCGGDKGPVEPVTPGTSTAEQPPPDKEPVLPEEGP